MEFFWLLLPVAAFSGWWVAGRGDSRRRQSARQGGLSADYFKGINYLLNEQPDKAIDVFIKVLEVDQNTVETHLALGNLYRRRGEMDRAIRIHQNLLARVDAGDAQRFEALLELAQDHLSAGLFDRAEALFRELVEGGHYKVQALRQLIDIYEQEKDWDKAISASRQLAAETGLQLAPVIAHYRCEKAEQAKGADALEQAMSEIGKALRADPSSIRARLLKGDLYVMEGDFSRATTAFQQVVEQDPDYLPEVVERLRACHQAKGSSAELIPYFSALLERHGGISVTLNLVELIQHENGVQEAIRFITEHLQQRPTVRGFDRLLDLEKQLDDSPPLPYLKIFKELTTQLMQERAIYRCDHCGYSAKSLHWKCPGCKNWNTIKPIQGVQDE